MAGTIPLSMTQQFDSLGNPLSLGKLYIFATATTTPQNPYQDSGLVTALPNPMTLDASGRVPQFFVADGTVKARLTDRNGNVQIEYDNILVIGPSGGGGGGATVDPTAIFQTGDPIWLPISGTRTGWVRMNNRTIGSATSGATERANSDTQALFIYLWTNFSDSVAGVSGGRGASALLDFNANKQIRIPDLRGRIPCGLDDMGNTAANNLSGVPFSFGNNITACAFGGEATHTLNNSELPVSNPNLTGVTPYNPGTLPVTASAGNFLVSSGSSAFSVVGTGSVQIYPGTASVAIPGYTADGHVSFGGGSAHNNTPLLVLGSFYVKL